jgi:hypothetical protein
MRGLPRHNAEAELQQRRGTATRPRAQSGSSRIAEEETDAGEDWREAAPG